MTQPPEEHWRPVPGYEGMYEVSDHGRVRSLPRYKVRTVRLLRASPHSGGYPAVYLLRDGRERAFRVHVLVLLAFVGPRPEGMQIRHLDGDKTNNTVGNLAYGTAGENMRDVVRHGVHHHAIKTHCAKGHPYDEGNVYHPPTRPRSRNCLACAADSKNRRRAAQRAAGVRVT